MATAVLPRVRIGLASEKGLLDRIHAFRYAIYVEEMGRVQHYADHDRRRIVDPLDRAGQNLVALDGDDIVGVMRVNFAADGPLGEYETLYGMRMMANDHPQRTSIATRLMIKPAYRGTMLAARIAMAAYDLGLHRGNRWNFLDCNDPLVPFFLGLGYVEHLGRIVHAEYGQVNSMVLDLADIGHLRAVRSPFAKTFLEHARWCPSQSSLAAMQRSRKSRSSLTDI